MKAYIVKMKALVSQFLLNKKTFLLNILRSTLEIEIESIHAY